MQDLIQFPDHEQSRANEQGQSMNIKDYYNCEQNYSIVSRIRQIDQDEYEIYPIQDLHSNIRSYYISIMTGEHQLDRLHNIEVINKFVRKLNSNTILENIQMINCRYYFLFKSEALKKLYPQFAELWRQSEIKNIYFMTNTYPIIDFILISALRMLLVYLEYSESLDLNNPLQIERIESCLNKCFITKWKINDRKHNINVVTKLHPKEKAFLNDLIGEHNFSKLSSQKQSDKSIKQPRKQLQSVQIHQINIETYQKRPLKPSKGKLQNLQTCIFYTLLQ